MLTTILITSAALLLLNKARKQSLSGIGKVKFYKAISEAQEEGITFGLDETALNKKELAIMQRVGERNGYKQAKGSKARGHSYAQAFYRYLNNKYKQISGIAAIAYPYKEYVVKDYKGDPIVIFHDYDREQDLKDAIYELVPADNDCTTETDGYYYTLAYLANGGKFVWKSKTLKDGTVTLYGVEDELYGSHEPGTRGRGKANHKAEYKSKRGVLGSEKSGAAYPTKFAEQATSYERDGDSHDVRNGVLAAIRAVNNRKDAEEILLEDYYERFKTQEMSEEDLRAYQEYEAQKAANTVITPTNPENLIDDDYNMPF